MTTTINTNGSENESIRELTTNEMADVTGGLYFVAATLDRLEEAARRVFDAMKVV